MTFATLVKKSLLPLLYLNVAAAVIDGVWLIFAGHLAGIWPLFLGFIFSPIVLPLLLLPTGFFAGVLRLVSNGGGPKPIVRILSVLSIGWIIVVMAGYALICYYVLAPTAATLPLQAKIYACGIALAPFALLAAKERDNLLFTGLVWFMQLSILATTLLPPRLGWEWDSWPNFWLFAGCMSAMVLGQSAYEALFLAKKPPGANLPDVPPNTL